MADEGKENHPPWENSKRIARVNLDGSRMIKGIHYEETYVPVVQWSTIRFFTPLTNPSH